MLGPDRVGLAPVGPPGTAGGTWSTVTVTGAEAAEALPAASMAITRSRWSPSAGTDGSVAAGCVTSIAAAPSTVTRKRAASATGVHVSCGAVRVGDGACRPTGRAGGTVSRTTPTAGVPGADSLPAASTAETA